MNDPLDLRGLKCPLPALLAKKALGKCAPGSVLTIWADDPLASVDIPHMCHGEGHAMQSVTPRDGFTAFVVTSGDDPA
jgi:tRNA 2-thiouridine synthesizing protein A